MALGNAQSAANERPKYKIQILHLHIEDHAEAAGELWTALHPTSGTGTSHRSTAAVTRLTPVHSLTTGRAPQTLIVDNAPPELKVQQPLPAPIAFATALQPPPPKREEVRVAPLREVTPEVTALPVIPLVSLPDPTQQAQNVTVIPRVNQTASESTAATRPEPADADPGAFKAAESTNTSSASLTSAGAMKSQAWPKPITNSQALPGAGSAGNPTNDIAQAGPPPDEISSSLAIPGTTRIDLPPDSKPNTSVLGESAQMPGRIVATVYLRMGLPKNWILEYWTSGAAASGLEAPWPYTMFRSNRVLPDGTDALLLRAHLTVEGRMEQLSLMTPTEWAPDASQRGTDKDTLFQALQEWRFRPASRNGKPVPVELLLVIPRQPD